MKRKFLYLSCTVAVLFSFALIENKAQVSVFEYFSVSNIKETIKNIARPLAYKSGLLVEPVLLQRIDFIDRVRFFKKSIDADGRVSMAEVVDGSLDNYFNSGSGLLVDGKQDLIVSRFDGEITDRKIIFNRNDHEFPLNLLRMLASLVKHGGLDESKKYEESLEILRFRSLSMTCGTVSNFSRRLLEDLGIESRVVMTITLEEWNTYDNGHTFLEVFVPYSKKWVAVDLDANVSFSTPSSENASMLEIMAVSIDNISFLSLARISNLDYSTFDRYQVISDFASLNKREWYSRVLQAFAIKDAATGKYVFAADDENKSLRIKSYSPDFTTVSTEKFAKMFYSSAEM